MGLRGDAVIAGIAEYAPERKYRGERRFTLEQWADLAALALAGRRSHVAGRERPVLLDAARVGDVRAVDGGRVPRLAASTSPNGSTSAGPRRSAWCGGRRPRSSWGCATWSCARRRAGRHRRSPANVPRTWSPFGASSNITGLAPGRVRHPLRQPRPERRLRHDRQPLRRRATATTRGPRPRSRPSSGRTPAPPPAPSSTTTRSRSTTCWPRRWSPTRCTCSRS